MPTTGSYINEQARLINLTSNLAYSFSSFQAAFNLDKVNFDRLTLRYPEMGEYLSGVRMAREAMDTRTRGCNNYRVGP